MQAADQGLAADARALIMHELTRISHVPKRDREVILEETLRLVMGEAHASCGEARGGESRALHRALKVFLPEMKARAEASRRAPPPQQRDAAQPAPHNLSAYEVERLERIKQIKASVEHLELTAAADAARSSVP